MNIDEARIEVVKWYEANLLGQREEDCFASHVSEQMKKEYFDKQEVYIDEVKQGMHDGNFTIRQKLHYYMTGVCVPLLPKV